MAFLSRRDLQDRLRGMVRGLDPEDARVALDDEFRGLMLEYTWSFARKNLVLTTVAAKTDGTIAVTAGGVVVTGTGTTFVDPDDIGKFIRLPDANIYEVLAVNIGLQTLTIADPYVGSVDVTGASYSLFQHRYTLADGIDRILSMGNDITAVHEGDQVALDRLDPRRMVVGLPYQYLPLGETAAGLSIIELHPVPFIAYHLPYVGMIHGSLDASTDLVKSLAELVLELGAARGALNMAGNGNVQEMAAWMRLSEMWYKRARGPIEDGRPPGGRLQRVLKMDRRRWGYPELQSEAIYTAYEDDPGIDLGVGR